MQQFTTALPSDTWSLSDLFENIEAVMRFEGLSPQSTRMTVEISFSARTETAIKILPFATEKFKTQTLETLEAIKKMIETENPINT